MGVVVIFLGRLSTTLGTTAVGPFRRAIGRRFLLFLLGILLRNRRNESGIRQKVRDFFAIKIPSEEDNENVEAEPRGEEEKDFVLELLLLCCL